MITELTVILRDRVNDLLQANADLEREVAKLRYAHSAMQAAEDAQEDAKSTRFHSYFHRMRVFSLDWQNIKSKCCVNPASQIQLSVTCQ